MKVLEYPIRARREMVLVAEQHAREEFKLPEPPKTLLVACDGSALVNNSKTPGAAGWCWFVSENVWAAGGDTGATNNQMELTALFEFLQVINRRIPPNNNVRILLDSQYVINCTTKWFSGWERNGWKTKSGSSVKNVELIKPIAALLKANPAVELEWIRGHAGHSLNEAADVRARDAAYAIQKNQNPNVGPGWKTRAKQTSADI